MVYNGYYKVMSNIPKMGQLPTPVQHLVRLHPSGIVNEDTQLSRKVEPVFSVFCNNSTWFTWLHFRWNNTPYIQEILQNPQMLQSNGMCNHMSSGVVLNWVDLFIDPSWMLFILSNWVVIHYPALLTSIVCREMKVHIITNYICESNYSISIYMLVHGNIQHGNRAPGKSRGLVFFLCPIVRFHILWKHTGFIWILLFTPRMCPKMPFLPVQKKKCAKQQRSCCRNMLCTSPTSSVPGSIHQGFMVEAVSQPISSVDTCSQGATHTDT